MTSATSDPPLSKSSWDFRLSAVVMRSVVEHERISLLFALLVFALFDANKACVTPLWFDEFFTFFISRLASFTLMLKAMPADGQPPLQYALTHLSLILLGQTEFAARLPELLAYVAAGFLTYLIVRRHGTSIQALFALSMVMGASVGAQAYTARPYGLLLAFTALTFASWQAATGRSTNRGIPLSGVSIGIAGAIMSHHFGLIHTGLFLFVGEMVRLIRSRSADGWMIVATAVGSVPLAITLPLAHRSHLILADAILHSTNYFHRPGIKNLLTYFLMFPLSLGLLMLLGCLLCRRKHESNRGDSPHSAVPAHEWAAALALSFLLPLMLIALSISVGQYATRYAIGTSLGLAILGAWGLPRLGANHIDTQTVLFCGTLGYVLILALNLLTTQIRVPMWRAHPAEQAVSPLLCSARGDLPIVVANALDYAPEWWYSNADLKQRLIYLSDVRYALEQPDFVPELSLVADRPYLPLPIMDYATFVRTHSRFLLLKTGELQLDWASSRLTKGGWHLETIARSGNDALFQVDRQQ
jgi:4-amino-4-deoxy-L-arabinose transferase-like glycosyltransferase